MRVLLPLPVTMRTSPAPGTGTSRRFSPSASEMRRPEPYNSAITAASRAQIQGSRASPARSSASVKRLAAAIWIGFGRLLPTLGVRIADKAPTLPLPSCSRNRPNERRPASARIRERPPISPARRIAMKATPPPPPQRGPPADIAGAAHRHESPDVAGVKRGETSKRHLRSPVLPEKDQTLADGAG